MQRTMQSSLPLNINKAAEKEGCKIRKSTICNFDQVVIENCFVMYELTFCYVLLVYYLCLLRMENCKGY